MALFTGPRYPTRPGALRRAADRSGAYLTQERQERRERADAKRSSASASVRGLVPNLPCREGAGYGRAIRPEVREVGLRTAVGLRTTPPAVMTGWRGRSDRRYAVTICAEAQEGAVLAAAMTSPVVALAVGRGPDGQTEILNASVLFGSGAALPRHPGANELHVHRLAESEAEARAVVDDLRPIETAAA